MKKNPRDETRWRGRTGLENWRVLGFFINKEDEIARHESHTTDLTESSKQRSGLRISALLDGFGYGEGGKLGCNDYRRHPLQLRKKRPE